MDSAVIDDVARVLADRCRVAANDPLAAAPKQPRGRGQVEDPLLREVAATQAEASAEAHVEASAMWAMAREYEREGEQTPKKAWTRKHSKH